MTRFKIAGEYIDLTEQKFAFQKKNVIFAFDDIECTRTTTINIPATPKNNRIFGLPGVPQFVGTGMRRKFNAQFEDGIVSDAGYLYLTKYNPNAQEYEAIYVTDLSFKGLQEAGALRDVFEISDFSETAVYNNTAISTHAVFGTYSFEVFQDYADQIYPSISLATILQRGLTKMGVAYVLPSGINEAYVTPVTAINQQGEEATVGQTIRAYENLPECTLVELIKITGYVTGTLPYFDDGTLKFENGRYDLWTTQRYIEKVVSIDSVERRFADWCQNNRIIAPGRKSETIMSIYASVKDDDGYGDYNNIIEPNAAVARAEHTSKYAIDNDNIEHASTLVEMSFTGVSDLGFRGRREAPLLRLRSGSSLLPFGNVVSPWGRTYSLPANPLIEQVCMESTAIQCTAAMSLIEFQTLTPRCLVFVNGGRYVWTEANWSDGKATLQLSKI